MTAQKSSTLKLIGLTHHFTYVEAAFPSSCCLAFSNNASCATFISPQFHEILQLSALVFFIFRDKSFCIENKEVDTNYYLRSLPNVMTGVCGESHVELPLTSLFVLGFQLFKVKSSSMRGKMLFWKQTNFCRELGGTPLKAFLKCKKETKLSLSTQSVTFLRLIYGQWLVSPWTAGYFSLV